MTSSTIAPTRFFRDSTNGMDPHQAPLRSDRPARTRRVSKAAGRVVERVMGPERLLRRRESSPLITVEGADGLRKIDTLANRRIQDIAMFGLSQVVGSKWQRGPALFSYFCSITGPTQIANAPPRLIVNKVFPISFGHQLLVRAAPLVSVPRPALLQSSVKLALQQVHDIFAQDGKELPAVERSSGGKKQALAMWVRTDDKVLVRRDSIPMAMSIFIRIRSKSKQFGRTSIFGTIQFPCLQLLFRRCPS